MDHPNILCRHHLGVNDSRLRTRMDIPTQTLATEFCHRSCDVHELELSADRADAELSRHCP